MSTARSRPRAEPVLRTWRRVERPGWGFLRRRYRQGRGRFTSLHCTSFALRSVSSRAAVDGDPGLRVRLRGRHGAGARRKLVRRGVQGRSTATGVGKRNLVPPYPRTPAPSPGGAVPAHLRQNRCRTPPGGMAKRKGRGRWAGGRRGLRRWPAARHELRRRRGARTAFSPRLRRWGSGSRSARRPSGPLRCGPVAVRQPMHAGRRIPASGLSPCSTVSGRTKKCCSASFRASIRGCRASCRSARPVVPCNRPGARRCRLASCTALPGGWARSGAGTLLTTPRFWAHRGVVAGCRAGRPRRVGPPPVSLRTQPWPAGERSQALVRACLSRPRRRRPPCDAVQAAVPTLAAAVTAAVIASPRLVTAAARGQASRGLWSNAPSSAEW